MTKPKPEHLLKRRRREPHPLDTPEINAMLDGLLRAAKAPEDTSGRGGILDQLSARCINRALAAEMEMHLGHKMGKNLLRIETIDAMAAHRKKCAPKRGLFASRYPATAKLALRQR